MSQFSDKSFDFCFTSPPYFNAEEYSNEEVQSYKKYSTYGEWFDNFLIKSGIYPYTYQQNIERHPISQHDISKFLEKKFIPVGYYAEIFLVRNIPIGTNKRSYQIQEFLWGYLEFREKKDYFLV